MFRQNVRYSPKVPQSKSKDLYQLPVNRLFGDIGQSAYVSDRRELLFDQDGRDDLVDFIICLDLLVGGRKIVWSPELCFRQA
jgi:hypothetical protein